jgi:hypothetical protein
VDLTIQSAVSSCTGFINTGDCQLSIPLLGAIESTVTYCASWYIGLSLDETPQCINVTQQSAFSGKFAFHLIGDITRFICKLNMVSFTTIKE